ncbi:hypothetical protein BGZ88_009954 [Linnemannia elongata]|nr:hypothetical protein BGZ88_009954 [Linnemannia elongata]
MSSAKLVVITGATSGIGQFAAIELAKKGAHLVLTARSEEKAAETRSIIEAQAPEALIDFHYADFSNLDQVGEAAAKIASLHERIDILINNAGIHAFEQRISMDGFSEMVAVNYLAPWLFTNILRKRLVNSSPSRIVNVGSEASQQSGGLDPKVDLLHTEPFSALGSSKIYGKTKLMNIMFSYELARQLEGTGVAVNCLCPGFNATGLGRELSFAAPLKWILNTLNIGDPRRGAGIIVRLATDPDYQSVSGGYYSVKAKLQTPISPGDDPDSQHELWNVTAGLLAERTKRFNQNE